MFISRKWAREWLLLRAIRCLLMFYRAHFCCKGWLRSREGEVSLATTDIYGKFICYLLSFEIMISLQKRIGCFNHWMVIYLGFRQSEETVVYVGIRTNCMNNTEVQNPQHKLDEKCLCLRNWFRWLVIGYRVAHSRYDVYRIKYDVIIKWWGFNGHSTAQVGMVFLVFQKLSCLP